MEEHKFVKNEKERTHKSEISLIILVIFLLI